MLQHPALLRSSYRRSVGLRRPSPRPTSRPWLQGRNFPAQSPYDLDIDFDSWPASIGCGRGEQLDDSPITAQGLAPPIDRNEREQTMATKMHNPKLTRDRSEEEGLWPILRLTWQRPLPYRAYGASCRAERAIACAKAAPILNQLIVSLVENHWIGITQFGSAGGNSCPFRNLKISRPKPQA
jgi:hypothetical protein